MNPTCIAVPVGWSRQRQSKIPADPRRPTQSTETIAQKKNIYGPCLRLTVSRNGECHTFPSTAEVRGTFYAYENVIKVMRIHARKLLLVAMSREPEMVVAEGGGVEKLRGSIYMYI